MSKSKRGLGDVELAGKVKTKTFKQLQLEKLLKSGAVVPAPKLAETKELEVQCVRDFESSIEDEERHRRSATAASQDSLRNQPLTRERFKE